MIMISTPLIFWPVIAAILVMLTVYLVTMYRLFRQMPAAPDNIDDLTDAEWAIVSEQCIRELAVEFTGVGTGGNAEAQLWPARPARRTS